jgi:hypothetical protein
MMSGGSFYLVLRTTRYGGLNARLTKKAPSLAAGEVAVALRVDLPTALFQRPTLRASVTIPDDAKLSDTITATVQSDLARVLSDRLGVSVRVTADNADE